MATSEQSAPGDVPRRQVYVRTNGRAMHTTVDELLQFFENVGKPVSVLNKHGLEPADGKVSEVALVTFKKDKAVEKALALSGQALGGREVVIGRNTRAPKPKSHAQGSVRVFVGNLPFDAEDGEVREIFAGVGTVLFVRFANAAEGSGRGFCHVIFREEGEPGQIERRAIARSGAELRGRQITVGAAINKSKPKKKEKQKVEAGAAASLGGISKAYRPADWRHDRKAGLTMPRTHTVGPPRKS